MGNLLKLQDSEKIVWLENNEINMPNAVSSCIKCHMDTCSVSNIGTGVSSKWCTKHIQISEDE